MSKSIPIRFQFDGNKVSKRILQTGVMQYEPYIKITIDYPLSKPYVLEATHADGSGWTRREFLEIVVKAYHEIYKNADEYGIWGHELLDLIIESAIQEDDGSWILEMAS